MERKNSEMARARAAAGWRERYAMQHGHANRYTDARGHICIRFTYSTLDEYQDANGATWDATTGEWVN